MVWPVWRPGTKSHSTLFLDFINVFFLIILLFLFSNQTCIKSHWFKCSIKGLKHLGIIQWIKAKCDSTDKIYWLSGLFENTKKTPYKNSLIAFFESICKCISLIMDMSCGYKNHSWLVSMITIKHILMYMCVRLCVFTRELCAYWVTTDPVAKDASKREVSLKHTITPWWECVSAVNTLMLPSALMK